MRRFVLTLFASLWTLPAMAQPALPPAPEILQFDTNGNGRIDQEEATPAFFTFINKVFMPALAPEGPVSAQPASSAAEVAVAPEETSEEGEAKRPAKSKVTAKLLLRRNVEDVSLSQDAKALDAADGAIIAYTNDYRQGTEEWQVQGAILYPIRYDTGREIVAGDRTLSAYTFVPSISFDRKFHSTDITTEVDTLAFRLGSEWEVAGGLIFPRQYFRIAPVYGTDFDFASAVVAGEFQYEALRESWGLGAPRSCLWARFNCQWRAILHLEGGKTLEAGDKTNLVENEEFLRLGPKLNAVLQPTFSRFDRLELKLAWTYLEDLLEEGGATDLFESAISWRLDDKGHLRLRAQYRHGDLSLTRDKVSIVTTGLEVKF